MKRREFIRRAAPALAVPTILNGISLRALGASPMMEELTGSRANNDHILVVIELNGGNDGLNTVIPIDQYSNLSAARSNVLIPQNKVLNLQGSSATGLHPAMTGLQEMYNDGKVRLVQSVGYPDPNFSHFRSIDIWKSAADTNEYLNTGWAGRYLNYEYPNYPTGYPNTTMPDPLAIEVGSLVSTMFMGPFINMAFAITDPTTFYQFLSGVQDPVPQILYGKELTYIRTIKQKTTDYSNAIKAAANLVTNQKPYPANNPLADNLKVVARLIGGGLKTKIYKVNIGGFDTHADQTDASDTTIGDHATLLKNVSEAIKAFHEDLKFLGVADKVVGMTYSEFGRRIKSNASTGTDHGAAAPMIIFGNKVLPGILGNNPTISSSTTANDNLPMQYDFRSVYASLLQDWLCVSKPAIDSTILLKNFQSLPLVDNAECAAVSIRELNQVAGELLVSVYPNPFTTYTNVQFTTGGRHTMVSVFNSYGQQIKTLVDADMQAGTHTVSFENEGYADGLYYVRFQNGAVQQVKPVVIAR